MFVVVVEEEREEEEEVVEEEEEGVLVKAKGTKGNCIELQIRNLLVSASSVRWGHRDSD